MAILEDRGIFWWNDEPVPETQFAPDALVGGKITIEDNGQIRLELDAMMPGEQHPFSMLQHSNKPIGRNIQGLLDGDTGHVLLLNVIRNGGVMRTDNVSQERYLALQCLVSRESFKPDRKKKPLRFHALMVVLTGFEDWLWLRAIQVNRGRTSLSVRYKKEKNHYYKVPFGKVSIEYDLSGPYFGESKRRQLNLVESACIKIKSRKSILLEDCETYYHRIEDLLILLTSSDHNLDWPMLVPSGSKQRAKLYFMRYCSEAKAPGAHECLINFPKIAASFGNLFVALVEKREQYGPGLYLYLGTRRGMKMFVEHRFVSLIWGLEAFDRHGRGKMQADKALRDKVDRILQQIADSKDRRWLRGKLKNVAEPSLADRLFSIFSMLPLSFDLAGLRRFCEECQARRNDISHFGGLRKNDQKYEDFFRDLDRKSDALAGLYHLHLLTMIGVSKELLDFDTNHNWPLSRIEDELRAAGLLGKKDTPKSEAIASASTAETDTRRLHLGSQAHHGEQ